MPTLSGQLKASLVKPLLFYLSHVAIRTIVGKDDVDGQMVSTAAWAFARMLQICDLEPIILSRPAADEACSLGHGFLRLHGVLAQNARAALVSRWNLRPKHHYMQESLLFMHSTLENMAKQTCMNEEDFMGKMKRIAVKTHRGKTFQRALQRYLIMLKLRWQNKLREP